MMKAKLTFLGTGTSQGIPIIGCQCPVCTSADTRDKRFRASALVEYGGLTILIDAGPDFRSQMLAAGVRHLDAILLTHNHKDHTGGLDDVRALNYIDRSAVNIYCEPRVLDTLKVEYDYAFAEDKYPGAPVWQIHQISEKPFVIYPENPRKELVWVHDVGYRYMMPDGSLMPTGNPLDTAEVVDDPQFTGLCKGIKGDGVEIIPIRGIHGQMPVLGFRFGNIAYITDMSMLPDIELEKLRGLDHVTLNTVSYKPHHSHFSLEQAVELARRIGAKHTWLTHLSHNFPVHEEFSRELLESYSEGGTVIQPAHDMLTLL